MQTKIFISCAIEIKLQVRPKTNNTSYSDILEFNLTIPCLRAMLQCPLGTFAKAGLKSLILRSLLKSLVIWQLAPLSSNQSLYLIVFHM